MPLNMVSLVVNFLQLICTVELLGIAGNITANPNDSPDLSRRAREYRGPDSS